VQTVALLSVLGSAFFHACWNALIKKETDSESCAVAVLAISAAVGSAWALTSPGVWFPNGTALAYSATAGLFEGLYFMSLGKALERAPLSSVYTASRGGAMLVVWPISVLFLGEELRWISVVGTGVLGVGLWLTGQGSPTRTEARGMAWAWACAATIGGYHLCQKQALNHHAAAPGVFGVSLFMALPFNLIRRGRPGLSALLQKLRESPWVLLAAGALCTLSFGLLLGALQTQGAGLVLTLRNTSILFALVLGLSQGETPSRPRISGAALVLMGAMLLGWPVETG